MADALTIVQGWKITNWEINDTPGGAIPSNLFQQAAGVASSTLLIGNAAADGFYSLAWLDANGYWWTVRGVAFDQNNGAVTNKSVMVDGRKPFGALVNLWIDEAGHLHGQLNDPFGGGNSGTFTAEANPIGDEGQSPGGKDQRAAGGSFGVRLGM